MTPTRSSETWGSDIVPVDASLMHARHRRPERSSLPDVVFVHGLMVSSRYFEPTAARLWEEASVWAPDMPGFGRSDNPTRALDVRGLGRALRRWLDVRGLSDVVVVANSFGCQYAVDLASRDPRGIRGLVLLGPTVDPDRRSALQQAGRYALNVPFERLSMGGVLAMDLWDAGPLRVAITYNHMLSDAIEQKLPAVNVPTLVVRGQRDTIAPQDWCERATSLLPQGTLRVIPRAAHTINYNSPNETADIVRSVLRSL